MRSDERGGPPPDRRPDRRLIGEADVGIGVQRQEDEVAHGARQPIGLIAVKSDAGIGQTGNVFRSKPCHSGPSRMLNRAMNGQRAGVPRIKGCGSFRPTLCTGSTCLNS